MSRNMLKAASDKFWFSRGQYLVLNADISDQHLCALAFEAGAQWQFHESCKVSPHIARFIEMVTLLWGEDTYAALTTGLRAETSGAETGNTPGDGPGGMSTMSENF